jgi:DNA-binding transcriptional ArsR family regulator
VQVSDPKAVRALAHPLRIQLIGLLREHGPMTATGLAARVGESSGSTSYHLRELARHGLIAEERDRGSARERYWRAIGRHFEFRPSEHTSPEGRKAMAQLRARIAERWGTSMVRFLEDADEYEPEWQDAVIALREPIVVTVDELTELDAKLEALLRPYRSDRRQGAPKSARNVTFSVLAIPEA